MLVRVFQDKERRELGEERWEVVWWTARPGANFDDFDPDRDIDTHRVVFRTAEAARAKARQVVDAGQSHFGQAEVQRIVVDWLCEEDRIAEWADAGDAEIID